MKIPFVKKFKQPKTKYNARDDNKNPSFNTPIMKYDYTPSYIKLGKRWGSISDIANKKGMNHDLAFSWFVNLLPDIKTTEVKAYFIEKDMVLGEAYQKDVEGELDKLLASVSNNGTTEKSTGHEHKAKAMRIRDVENARNDLSSNGRIVVSEIKTLFVSDDPDKISEQMTNQQRVYDKEINGVYLTSVAGEQEETFKTLLDRPIPDIFKYTWTTQDFANNDHMIRKGLLDRKGIPVGKLNSSYTSGFGLMDLDGSFSKDSQKVGQVIIAASASSRINSFFDYENLSAASCWGQLIANHAMTANLSDAEYNKTFHLVLNGFDYRNSIDRGEDKFVMGESFVEATDYHDMSFGGLNPIEGFGLNKDAANIYERKIDYLAQMLYLLSHRSMNEGTKTEIRKALRGFYESNGYWDKDASEEGQGYLNRFINLADHSKIGTLGDFAKKITNLVSRTSKIEGATENQKDEVRKAFNTLDEALESRPLLFNRHSKLPNRVDKAKLQHYFDLSSLSENLDQLESQILVVLPYILANAKHNDIVMLHGMDKISIETWEFVNPSIETAKKRGVRFVYIFDTIGAEAVKDDTKGKEDFPRLDVFNARGILYSNLESDFDYQILGMMNREEIERYSNLIVSEGSLPPGFESLIGGGGQNSTSYQVRRPADFASNVITADFII